MKINSIELLKISNIVCMWAELKRKAFWNRTCRPLTISWWWDDSQQRINSLGYGGSSFSMHTYDLVLKQIQNVMCCCSFKHLNRPQCGIYLKWMEEVIVGQKKKIIKLQHHLFQFFICLSNSAPGNIYSKSKSELIALVV